MKSLFITLYNPKKGLALIDNEYEDVLLRKYFIVLIVYIVAGFIVNNNVYKDEKSFAVILLHLFVTICFLALVGMVLSYILLKIGKWVGGKASYIEVLSVLTCSLFPLLITFTVVSVFINTDIVTIEYGNLYLRNCILFFSYFLHVRIAFIGLKKFNNFDFKRGVITMLPILMYTIIYLIVIV